LYANSEKNFRGKDMIMNTLIEAKKQSEMAAHTESAGADVERLVRCGFTAEEIAALLWLQQGYQTGGSDRVELVRHWEFLKYLVLTNKVDV
jgi:hypothetical protein